MLKNGEYLALRALALDVIAFIASPILLSSYTLKGEASEVES
jgi:hypothetical protein